MGSSWRTSSLRIIAGKSRHLPLITPTGDGTRPTTDRIKETLFNMLQYQLADIVFLDLFSGSGGICLEAVSRGAAKGYMVENSKEAIKCIKENMKSTHLEDSCMLVESDVESALIHQLPKYLIHPVDIIFMDPPYQAGIEERLFQIFSTLSYVDSNTLIIVEAEKKRDFSFVKQLNFEIEREKIYKTNKHVFIRAIKETNET